MQYKIGKVRNFENGAGLIVTPEKSYLFLDSDLVDYTIKNEDIVIFGDEGKDRAFFVKKLKNNIIEESKSDEKVK